MNYQRDKRVGVCRQVEIPSELYSLAQQFALHYGKQLSLRNLDALHLATAKHHGVEAFGTYDRRLAAAAYHLGLSVVGTRP